MIQRSDLGGIALLQLQHGKVNAVDLELLAALEESLREVAASPARAVVLTGSGSSFSAGVDLFRVLDGGAGYVQRFLPRFTSALLQLFTFPRPVIAALNGHAIAGGCIFACACDLRLLADGGGRVGVPELRVGVPFPALALEVLRFAVPAPHFQELVLSGTTHAAPEALRRGLVDAVVPAPELVDRARAAAEALAAIPAPAFEIGKTQMRHPALEQFERWGEEIDRRVVDFWSTPSAAEAIRAYLERTLRK